MLRPTFKISLAVIFTFCSIFLVYYFLSQSRDEDLSTTAPIIHEKVIERIVEKECPKPVQCPLPSKPQKIQFAPLQEEEPHGLCPAVRQLKSHERVRKLVPHIDMKVAVATFISTEQYLEGARTLLHAFKKHNNIQPDFIALVVKDRLSPRALCMLKEVGWKLHEVDVIQPPKAPTLTHFNDQFTKLHLFKFKQYDKIMYLDCDLALLKPIEELFLIPGRFAATTDWWDGRFTFGLNAGLFVAEPSDYIYNRLMDNMKHTDKYGSWGEQDYFNWVFGHSTFRLPAIYNANKAIYVQNQGIWDCEIQEEVKVIHYTMLPKPFYDPFEHTRSDAFMKPWWDLYDDMIKTYGPTKCPA